MGLGQCVEPGWRTETPISRDEEMDVWRVQGRWCETASGRGAQGPWLRKATSEGMQAILDFRQFSILGGRKDLVGLAFFLLLSKFRQSPAGVVCSLTTTKNPQFMCMTGALILEVKFQFYVGRCSRTVAFLSEVSIRIVSTTPREWRQPSAVSWLRLPWVIFSVRKRSP